MGAPTDDEMRATLALIRKHGSVAAAAKAFGVKRNTLASRVNAARARFPGELPAALHFKNWATSAAVTHSDALSQELPGGGEQPEVAMEKPRVRVKAGSAPIERMPLSEDQRKFHADWSAQDCINELRRIAEIDTDKVITRNYFRVHSDISESTWSRYFGTMEEFKRQAQITISRHAHRMERDIAKHASVDKSRLMNVSKRQWEDKYLMPMSGRWQTVIVANDVHDLQCDPFWRRVFLDTLVRVQPEKVVFGGDLFDLPDFSKHTKDPRSFQLLERIEWVHQFLSTVRAAAPNAELTLIAGNHEERLLRHLSEETPAMMVILADLHGYNVSRLLGLEEFGVNFISRADMTAFTNRDKKIQLQLNYMKVWDSILLGHFPHQRHMGMPGANGHHHVHIVWPGYSPSWGPFEWHQTGAGHRREASYCAGEKWSTGFLMGHVDTLTKRTQFEYVELSHPGAMVGGRFYSRTRDEAVPDLIFTETT